MKTKLQMVEEELYPPERKPTNWVCDCKTCNCLGPCLHAKGLIYERDDLMCPYCGAEKPRPSGRPTNN